MTSDSAAAPTAGHPQTAFWNGRSGQAWVGTQTLLDALFQPMADRLIAGVPAGAPLRVLDIGCGTGAVALAIARRLGDGGHVRGVDISRPMIAAADTRAACERIAVWFVCADAQRHRFEPGSIDRIVSRFGVMFFDDPVAAFANLRRAAADGATLHAIVWRSVEENAFLTAAERAAASLLPQLPPRHASGPGPFALADAPRTQAMLEAAGWSGIAVTPLEVECTLPVADLPAYYTRIGPLGLVWPDLDDVTRSRVDEVVRAAYGRYRDGDVLRFNAACWDIGARAG